MAAIKLSLVFLGQADSLDSFTLASLSHEEASKASAATSVDTYHLITFLHRLCLQLGPA